MLRIIWWLAERTLPASEYQRRLRAYYVGFGFRYAGRNWGKP